jgi:hypothetical protein
MNDMTTRARASLAGVFFLLSLISPLRAVGEPVESSGNSHAISKFSAGRIFINGREFQSGYRTLVREGIAFIPISEELEFALGADVEQTPVDGSISLSFKTYEAELIFTENKTALLENGIERKLESPPFFLNGLLYVPLRDFFTNLGCEVKSSDNDFYITKATLFPDIISEIPEDILAGASPVAAGEERTPAATETQTIPSSPMSVGKRFTSLQYTYENSLEFENTTVSGDRAQSNMIPKTDFYQRFSFRAEGKMQNGYDMRGIFKSSATTERVLNGGKVDTFNLTFTKNKISMSLYDLAPKVSRYVLRSYPLQGALYERENNHFGWTALWGKTPKRLGDTPYNRYGQAAIFEKSYDKSTINLAYVRTKDTGAVQDSDRIDNSVISAYGSSNAAKMDLSGEFAFSKTKLFYEDAINSKAKWLELKYKNRQTNIFGSYERVGSGFYSETSFFTPGRREYQILATHKPQKDLTLGGGYTSTKLSGDSSFLIPLQATITPFESRPRLKLKLQKDYEKSRSSFGPRITDKRKFDISDRVGKAKVDMTFERNRQKDTWGDWRFRTAQRYRYITDITKKLQMFLQFKTELKTLSSNPKKRYYQYKYIYELGEWSELSFNAERYYNGTSNDRFSNSFAFKKLDVMNDREYSIEYQFLNYRVHNDNCLMLSYSYVR